MVPGESGRATQECGMGVSTMILRAYGWDNTYSGKIRVALAFGGCPYRGTCRPPPSTTPHNTYFAFLVL